MDNLNRPAHAPPPGSIAFIHFDSTTYASSTCWIAACPMLGPEVDEVHRSIEIVIGRLITDEEFRRSFQEDPHSTLAVAGEWGLTLSPSEVRALLATDASLWDRVAGEVDERLQKASLRTR